MLTENDLIGFFNRHLEIREPKAIHARFFVAENGRNNGRYSAKSQQDIKLYVNYHSPCTVPIAASAMNGDL